MLLVPMPFPRASRFLPSPPVVGTPMRRYVRSSCSPVFGRPAMPPARDAPCAQEKEGPPPSPLDVHRCRAFFA